MSKLPLVSVIIPVYKVEEFLPRCLDSIERQTYPQLEIILVDDGSPDRCGIWCDEYAGKHSNTKVIHQKNQGLSAARNNGVKGSNGDYITFIDSDDYVSADYVEYMVNLILKYQADVSVGAYKPVYQQDNLMILDAGSKQKEYSKVLSKEEAMCEACYAQKFGVSAWAKLYKRKFVEKHPYPVGKLYEELATTYKILSECNRVAYGSRFIYFYVQRKGSIMHSKIGERELYGLTAAKEQLAYMETNYPSVVHAARVRVTIKVQQYMPALFSSNGKENKKMFLFLRNEIKPYFKETIKDAYVVRNLKIKLISIMLGYYPAKGLFFLIRKKRFGN